MDDVRAATVAALLTLGAAHAVPMASYPRTGSLSMRCGPRSIFVWYTAADAAGNADGLKPTKHDSISKRIGTALLKLLAHGVSYVPNGTGHRTGAYPGALSRTGNGFVVTSEALGFILVHHKDLAERLRSGLRAKQQGGLCRRAGEQTLLTSGCHATTGKEEGVGIFVMMDATRMVNNYHMCWTGILAPALTIGLVVPSRKSSEGVHQHQETNHVRALFLQRR